MTRREGREGNKKSGHIFYEEDVDEKEEEDEERTSPCVQMYNDASASGSCDVESRSGRCVY